MWTISMFRNGFGAHIVKTRGGQKNWTEPSQTEPTEPKPIQTEPKYILNCSVEDFPKPNGSAHRTEKPMCFCNYLN